MSCKVTKIFVTQDTAKIKCRLCIYVASCC